MTPPPEFLRFAADREAALAQLAAAARALADAPVWLVGPDPAVEAALAAPGGRVSGVVVTSAGARTGSCTESFSYFDPGTGAPPKVTFDKSGNKSGDACPAGAVSAPAFGAGTGPAITGPAVPAAKPGAPRIIEASAQPDGMSSPARQAYMRQLAELIKGAPPG